MSAPTTDFPGLTQACTDAISAIESGDFLTARKKALEAQLIVLAVGSQTTAGSTSLQLAIDTVDKILANIQTLEAYQNAKTSNGRLIRTGLANGRRRGGIGFGGVIHD